MPADIKWGDQYARKTDAFSATGYWRRDIKLALSHLSLSAKGAFLDFACGTGRTLQLIAEAYPSAVLWGVDINDKGFDLCLQRAPRSNLTTEADTVPKNSVDCCTIIHAISQIEDPDRELGAIWHMLKPGGQLIIVCENHRFMQARSLIHWLQSYSPDPTIHHNYTMGPLVSVLKDNGFLIDEAYHYGGRETRLIPFLQPRMMIIARRPS